MVEGSVIRDDSRYVQAAAGTGSPHTHTLDKNGSLYDPSGTESWDMQTSLDR